MFKWYPGIFGDCSSVKLEIQQNTNGLLTMSKISSTIFQKVRMAAFVNSLHSMMLVPYLIHAHILKDRSRVQFLQGDACNLPNLGQFGCLFVGNALHHLPNPMAFLDQVPDILVPGGILVIADFYMWTEEHLAKVVCDS